MILYFQFEDLSKIFSVSKLDMNRPRIKLIITFCAVWQYWDLGLKGLRHGILRSTGNLKIILYKDRKTPKRQ